MINRFKVQTTRAETSKPLVLPTRFLSPEKPSHRKRPAQIMKRTVSADSAMQCPARKCSPPSPSQRKNTLVSPTLSRQWLLGDSTLQCPTRKKSPAQPILRKRSSSLDSMLSCPVRKESPLPPTQRKRPASTSNLSNSCRVEQTKSDFLGPHTSKSVSTEQAISCSSDRRKPPLPVTQSRRKQNITGPITARAC